MNENIIVGVVTEKNQSVSTDRGRNWVSTFILISGAVKVMAQCESSKLPKEGSIAAFSVKQSRSGKMAVVTAVGWPHYEGKGSLNKGEVKFHFNKVLQLEVPREEVVPTGIVE